MSERLRSERQFDVVQVFAGLDQDQRAFVGHHHGGTLARHMGWLGLGCNGGLHCGNFCGVGVDPLQTGAVSHLNQAFDWQCKGLHFGQTGGGRCSRCCCNRRWCLCHWGCCNRCRGDRRCDSRSGRGHRCGHNGHCRCCRLNRRCSGRSRHGSNRRCSRPHAGDRSRGLDRGRRNRC